MKRTTTLSLILAALMIPCVLVACNNETSSGDVVATGAASKITTLKDKTFVCSSYTVTQRFYNAEVREGENDGHSFTSRIYTYTNYVYFTGISDSVVIEYRYDGSEYIATYFSYFISDNTIRFRDSNGFTIDAGIITSDTSFTITGDTFNENGYKRILSDLVFSIGTAPSWGTSRKTYQ